MCSFVCSSIFVYIEVLYISFRIHQSRKSNHLFGNDHKISICQCALKMQCNTNDDVKQHKKGRTKWEIEYKKRIVANASRMRKMKYFALSSTGSESRCSCCVGVLFIYYILSFYSVEKSVSVYIFFFFTSSGVVWYGLMVLDDAFVFVCAVDYVEIFIEFWYFIFVRFSLKCTQTATDEFVCCVFFLDDDVFPGELQLFAQLKFDRNS